MKKIYRSIGSIGLGWLIGSCGESPTGPPRRQQTLSSCRQQRRAWFRLLACSCLPQPRINRTRIAAVFCLEQFGSREGDRFVFRHGRRSCTRSRDHHGCGRRQNATSTITVLDGGVVRVRARRSPWTRAGFFKQLAPSGALDANTSLWIVPSTAFVNDPRVVKGTPFDFLPTGTTFTKPVSIRIKYNPANLPPGTEKAALQLHLSSASSGWQAIEGSTVDTRPRL